MKHRSGKITLVMISKNIFQIVTKFRISIAIEETKKNFLLDNFDHDG